MRFSAFCSYGIIPLEQNFWFTAPKLGAGQWPVSWSDILHHEQGAEWEQYPLPGLPSLPLLCGTFTLWEVGVRDIETSFFLVCGACGRVSALRMSTGWENGTWDILAKPTCNWASEKQSIGRWEILATSFSWWDSSVWQGPEERRRLVFLSPLWKWRLYHAELGSRGRRSWLKSDGLAVFTEI